MSKKSTEQQIKIYYPYGEHPPANYINISEFEDIWEYDSKLGNIINTGQKRNIQVEIEAFKDQTLIYNILDKYAGIKNPEDFKALPELNKKEGFYADLTQLPNNIHELKKLGELAQQKIKELQELEKQQNDLKNQTLFGNETNIQEIKKAEQRTEQANKEDTKNK